MRLYDRVLISQGINTLRGPIIREKKMKAAARKPVMVSVIIQNTSYKLI